MVRSALLLFALLALIGAPTPGVYAQGFDENLMTFQVGEPGARVYVDDWLVGETDRFGTLDEYLAPGTYEVQVEKEGFETRTQPIRVGVVSQSFSVPIEKEPTVPWAVIAALVGAAILVLAMALYVARQRRRSVSFDRFRVERPIGRGGMATVFLARDGARRVALKVMDPALLTDGDLVRKFLKEGEVLQRIAAGTPGAPVVRALSYGRERGVADGRPYVALEYIPGDTLLNFVRQTGRMPVRHVLAVSRQVCEGLAAAHREGVWHRDVSPDNVLLDGKQAPGKAPTVKLIDFGVAKHEYTQARTLDGSIAGKPAYMSPEQCGGKAVDGRSDLYAVGVMMYTLLAGHPPFTDPNPLLVMRLHETAPVPPLPADVPVPVVDMVMRLLAKDRAERPASATEVAARLSALERMN